MQAALGTASMQMTCRLTSNDCALLSERSTVGKAYRGGHQWGSLSSYSHFWKLIEVSSKDYVIGSGSTNV